MKIYENGTIVTLHQPFTPSKGFAAGPFNPGDQESWWQIHFRVGTKLRVDGDQPADGDSLDCFYDFEGGMSLKIRISNDPNLFTAETKEV